ncbi:MAG: hypothetical protein GTO45_27250 [Candidatus Aminicenantes bacterium]|nr:hypothetical protein [Candidatus Aminicenantes bacterium]NIM82479.1 hypothetical protein [Candidatus Aminicenantes bacterium]NIN21854.1 hypothetical protein [Candidatus Aminicenantes bacterium]NIN45632.1 hypothetical protein [Candidatus Aminicenantes bacterium]NIN88465.1 hypothetical protein [Candidatus Aminicenantes bacterium]
MKKAETFLLDTMVLINFAERCESCDLFEYFGKGELFSSLYFITQNNLKFVSDEKLVSNVFKDKFKTTITRTMDLLDILVSNRLITETKKDQIFEEMIKHGFWLKR